MWAPKHFSLSSRIGFHSLRLLPSRLSLPMLRFFVFFALLIVLAESCETLEGMDARLQRATEAESLRSSDVHELYFTLLLSKRMHRPLPDIESFSFSRFMTRLVILSQPLRHRS